jgi:hypothetical protein
MRPDFPSQWDVNIGGSPIGYLAVGGNSTPTSLYFIYDHSVHKTIIKVANAVPEFPLATVLLLLINNHSLCVESAKKNFQEECQILTLRALSLERALVESRAITSNRKRYGSCVIAGSFAPLKCNFLLRVCMRNYIFASSFFIEVKVCGFLTY